MIGLTASTDECIEWDMCLDARYYGRKSVKTAVGWRPMLVHRLVWEEVRGPIPEGMSILHRCDNPPCINIDHLFIGTQGDNMRDMTAKGHNAQKERTHCPKGHPLEAPNLVTSPSVKQRKCLKCHIEYQAAYCLRRKEQRRKAKAGF